MIARVADLVDVQLGVIKKDSKDTMLGCGLVPESALEGEGRERRTFISFHLEHKRHIKLLRLLLTKETRLTATELSQRL